MKRIIAKMLVVFVLCFILLIGSSCASCDRALKSCNADISGGLYRIINIYSLDGQLLATYEGKVDIDNNQGNNSVMFEL